MQEMAVDTRRYERAISEAGATEYEEAITKRSLMIHRYFTTSKWGRMFPNGVFLDYGCGTGVVSRFLVRMGLEVVAFDFSKKMCKISKETCSVPVVVADALNLPFREKSFSTVCVSGVLHHIHDLERTFEELCRVSRHFVCIDEISTTPPPLIMRLIQLFFQFLFSLRKRIFTKSVIKGWRFYGASEYERPLNPNYLVQLYEKNGFRVVGMRFFNDIPLSHLFLPESVRKYVFAKLISSKGGIDVEIIAKRVKK